MIEKRSFDSLGRFRNDWLNARHHFSFGGYHDPSRMGWGTIRVWNDDEIAPQSGFDPHPHADMEIITYVREGAITHKDSLGNMGRTEAGDVQVMSAGTGIVHAEYNLEHDQTTLYQIWISPAERGLAPSWDAAKFPKGDRTGKFAVLASGFDEDGAVPRIRTPSRVLGATLDAGETVTYETDPARHQYLGVAKGTVLVNGIVLGPRDAAAITAETGLVIEGAEDAEIVLVDAP
jgi:quercetin 2,3-dioxygenase